MRYIVYGAGAVGGVVAVQLATAGSEVVVIARGAHLDAIRSKGLVLETPDGSSTHRLPVAGEPAEAKIGTDDVVLLAVKSHDTDGALQALVASTPADTHIVCLQNGVENERRALRSFTNVHAAAIVLPGAHLEPGVVQSYSSPTVGLLDIGRYPTGVDEGDERVAADFNRSGFDACARPDVMRWKWNKLVVNLGNTVEALCGAGTLFGPLATLARAEARACFAAAGIDAASDAEDEARRGDHLDRKAVGGQLRPGSSTWQSLARGLRSVEADWFNGEVALLGRLHGVPTPVNSLLQRLANEQARAGAPPGSFDQEELLAMLGRRA